LAPGSRGPYNATVFASCCRFGRAWVLLLTFCVCVVALGCAGARTSGEAGPDNGDRKNPETDAGNSSQESTAAAASEPPASTLSYGGETVEAGLGGYCWTAGGAATCVDAVGISLGGEKLAAPSGVPLSFEYEGDRLDSLDVAAYEVGTESGGKNRIRHDILVPPYKGVGKEDRPKVSRSGNRARILATLPAGEYVLDVRAGMPEGDASYGFRLVVEDRKAHTGEGRAIATLSFDPPVPVQEVRRMATEHGVESGRIEGRYRVGGEVHTWGSTQGLGTDFEKQQLGAFADMVDGAEQMSPEDQKELAPETPAMKKVLESGDARPVEISGIEFYGTEPVLEALIQKEDASISKATVTTEPEMREILRNLPEGCCD
jgi:hypothetical protein